MMFSYVRSYVHPFQGLVKRAVFSMLITQELDFSEQYGPSFSWAHSHYQIHWEMFAKVFKLSSEDSVRKDTVKLNDEK